MEQIDYRGNATKGIGIALLIGIISLVLFYVGGWRIVKSLPVGYSNGKCFEEFFGFLFLVTLYVLVFLLSLTRDTILICGKKRKHLLDKTKRGIFVKIFIISIGFVGGGYYGCKRGESAEFEKVDFADLNNSDTYADLGTITIYSDWGDGKGLRTRPGNLWVKSYNGEKFYYVGTSESKNLLSRGSWNVYGNSFNAMFHSESGNIKHYLNVSAWPSANIVHSGSGSSGGGSYPVQPGYPASDGSYPIGSTNYDTHSGFSSSQGKTQQRERVWRDCSHCHGKGTVVHDSYIATFGNDSKAYCAQCGQSYWRSTGHSHVTCPICHGNRGRWSE